VPMIAAKYSVLWKAFAVRLDFRWAFSTLQSAFIVRSAKDGLERRSRPSLHMSLFRSLLRRSKFTV
jgi:hypothetical protein